MTPTILSFLSICVCWLGIISCFAHARGIITTTTATKLNSCLMAIFFVLTITSVLLMASAAINK